MPLLTMSTDRDRHVGAQRRSARWPVVLLVGCSVLLSIAGLVVVGLFAFFAPFDLVPGPDQDVDTPAERIRAASLPFVADISVERDWLDGPMLWVTLVATATDDQARGIWCDLILPTGIDDAYVSVGLDAPVGDWPAPGDCADPANVPALQRWPD